MKNLTVDSVTELVRLAEKADIKLAQRSDF
jgi:hypothetical protein